jgi:hypothetical protein
LHPLLGEKFCPLVLKLRWIKDEGKKEIGIPAEDIREKEEGGKPGKISRFFLVREIININFDVPKVK